MAKSLIRAEYERAGLACRRDCKSLETGAAILEMVIASLHFLLEQCQSIELVSKVPGKDYFTFTNGTVMARPANRQFFVTSVEETARLWQQWLDETITPDDFARLSYTCALAPCLAMEIFDRGNKKGPATQFEWFVGHLFSKAVGVNPTETVRLPVQGQQVMMTMDLLLDLGPQYRKVHLPVKMSTRERGVQAWSHQRLLDAAYGDNTYRGILVAFSETKLDSRSREVVEICVPGQWLAYQSLLAQLDRIYYFDVPAAYQLLTKQYPDVITIRPFRDFFVEQETLLHSLTPG